MRRFVQMSLAGLVVSFTFTLPVCVQRAGAQSAISGYWDAKMPNNDGTFRETFFQIEQQGEAISGELIRHPRGIPITGTLKGNAIHFVTVPPPPPPAQPGQPPRRAPRPVTYDGTIENGKLILNTEGRTGPVTMTAEKVTKEATEPPLRCPCLH